VRLREALAQKHGVGSDELLVGVGSDELITLLLTAFSVPRGRAPSASVVTTTPTFVMYRMSARVRGLSVVEVPLDDAWNPSPSSLIRAVEMASPNLIFLASPNNPTGTMASPDTLEQVIVAASNALVVVDEAYVDYASRDQLDVYKKHDNVAILRTLSKVGFAALRIGWMIARPPVVRALDKVRLPYNMPTLSQTLGAVVVSELSSELETVQRSVVAERAWLAGELARLSGVTVTPSEANFLWFRTARPAGDVFAALAERKVLVRSFHSRGGRLAHQLRVTIGTHDENARFLSALADSL
jgi:histidinol-phosphate aminotransferase